MSETTFAEGFFFDRPRENAPEWVIGKMNVQVEKAIAFLRANANERGYVNLDIKEAKSGKPYVALDTWKPKTEFADPSGGPIIRKEEDATDLPF